jgi:hypothetical protein
MSIAADEASRQRPSEVEVASAKDEPRVRPGSDRGFWIPDAGIEREIITHEITRHLGMDALVRPGKNDVCIQLEFAERCSTNLSQRGQSGYLITAFRAPTTACTRS